MSDLGTLTGSAMASAGSKKKLKKVGSVWMDEGGQYFTDEQGTSKPYKTQAEAEHALSGGSAMQQPGGADTAAPASAMDAGGKKQAADPALANVAHLMQNQKWSDAWNEISKLDEKAYAKNTAYIQMKRLIKEKAGL